MQTFRPRPYPDKYWSLLDGIIELRMMCITCFFTSTSNFHLSLEVLNLFPKFSILCQTTNEPNRCKLQKTLSK